MANARTKVQSKKESIEELQQKRTNLYFAMGDRSYHIKVLETDILNITQQISALNKTISEMVKEREKQEATKKLESKTEQTANA